jgi:hypothetical protein
MRDRDALVVGLATLCLGSVAVAGNWHPTEIPEAAVPVGIQAGAEVSSAIAVIVRVPDLVPTALEAPVIVDAGDSVMATWTVANRGDGTARASWHDRLYLSTDQELSPGTDHYLGDASREAAVAAGGSYSASLKFTVPTVAPGLYYLILQVDRYDRVYETDETNNVRAKVLGPDPGKQLALSLLPKSGATKSTQIRLTTPPATLRLELAVDDHVVGTVYALPPAGGAATALPTDALVMATAESRVAARAFDTSGNLMASSKVRSSGGSTVNRPRSGSTSLTWDTRSSPMGRWREPRWCWCGRMGLISGFGCGKTRRGPAGSRGKNGCRSPTEPSG